MTGAPGTVVTGSVMTVDKALVVRATLVDLELRSRVTIDVNLSWFDRESSRQADHLALIETKSLLDLAL